MRIGLQHVREARPEQGLHFLKQAVWLRPDNIESLHALAAAHLRSGDEDAAQASFDRILRISPENAEAHYGRGLVSVKRGETTNARLAFRAAAENSKTPWKYWGALADIKTNAKERREAIHKIAKTLAKHCRVHHAAPTLYADCVSALIDDHRPGEAAAFVKECWSKFESETIAHDKLAGAYYRAGHFEHAFTHKLRALWRTEPGTRPACPVFSPSNALAALRAFGDYLSRRDLPYFLAAGTLLGVLREGAPLAHDRDVDIGIVADKWTRYRVFEALRHHPGMLLRREATEYDRYFALKIDGIGIDIFLHDPVGKHLVCGFSRTAGDIQWRFSAFGRKHIQVGEDRWPIPDAPERYLTESYGAGWQIPDKGFASVIGSPALHDVHPHARAFYAAARARNALLNGDIEKAEALVRQSPVLIQWPVLAMMAGASPSSEEGGLTTS